MNTDDVRSNSSQETEKTEYALDDARRVKVLSPSMMVFKRFVRNKLAIVGFVILVVMFVLTRLHSYSRMNPMNGKRMQRVDTIQIPNISLRRGLRFPLPRETSFCWPFPGKQAGSS